jgi:putative ABC transport system permease protein
VLFDDQTLGWLRTIVGVVGNVRTHAVGESAAPAVYIAHGQHPDVIMPSLVLRSSLPPAALASSLRQRLAAFDSHLLVQRIRPMDEVVSGALTRPRFNLMLIGSFALLGMLLAAVGIYGVVSYLVTQRTREIGIRMALGARAPDVVRLMMTEGMGPVIGGALAGVAAGAVATRAIRTMLYGVTPLDPVSIAAAPVLLIAVALLACYLPSRRATAVDPLVALRDE